MYIEAWPAIADRIRGLAEATELHKNYPQDSFGRVRGLRGHVEGVLSSLRAFRDRFRQKFPVEALAAIDEVLEQVGKLLPMATGGHAGPKLRDEAVFSSIFHLCIFATLMTAVLADVQIPLRALSDRAFQHLQRLIAVDDEVRKKWQAAFASGEVDCEKLGAVHLLGHGIWAFKINASGGRTDLVYQEPAGSLIKEQQYAEGFVLTEWKVAKSAAEVETKCREAREQTKLYTSGVLGGTELTGYRYIVVVSEKEIRLPEPHYDGGIEYRYVNIVVDPSTPSVAARNA
jgi:hypothetical protein